MKLPYGPPNTSLLRELRQVDVDAKGIVRALKEVNLLPDTFPREVLEDICSSLSGLKSGTAENCRPVLEYARNKIPEIRRENFYLEEDDLNETETDPAEPRLYRGMVLDRRLNMLLASITTALDEYRVQAQERFDDEVRGEEVVSLRHPGETAEAAANAAAVIDASQRARSGLQEKGIDQTERGEVLSRRLQDGENLAFAARSQIRAAKIVRRWFEGLSTAIAQVPDLIGKAGKAIKVGTDISDALADWWSNTERKLLKATIDSVRGFGIALEEIGEKLKQRRGPPTSKATEKDAPRDPATLRAEAEVERMMKAGIAIPEELAQVVEEIDVRGTKDSRNRIARWQDVASFTSLRSLRATYTNFDLSQHARHLAGKLSLSSVSFPPQESNDLAPLGELTTLTSLSLYANSATDLAPLGDLTALTSLSLHVNSATDLAPLRELTALTRLALYANSATDLAPLGDLTALTSLTLYANSATDLAPLKELTALTRLALYANSATDLAPLGDLTALTSLSLHVNSATDLAPLGDLTALISLSLHAMKSNNWEAAMGSARLKKLQLTRASMEGYESLGKILSLEDLYIDSSGAFDLERLSPLTSLKKLRLKGMQIVNRAALKDVDLTIYP